MKFKKLLVIPILYRNDNSFSKLESHTYEEFSNYYDRAIIFIQGNKIANILAGERVEYEIPLKNKKVITDVHERDLVNITEVIRYNNELSPIIIYAYLITICLLCTILISYCFCIYVVKPLFNYFHKNDTYTVQKT